ncbi:hypothetical protein [Hyphomicrobium sp.]|uniref:hypothetical protein n=1 Tax=Hyphomicrobium sp. TaxID=82 RepID=UPI001D750D7D|nr:hypothetical protein [Hyphomicrobium sp.]MBY0561494.1 hypothetical protein [Hyphomicrobium sp.]
MLKLSNIPQANKLVRELERGSEAYAFVCDLGNWESWSSRTPLSAFTHGDLLIVQEFAAWVLSKRIDHTRRVLHELGVDASAGAAASNDAEACIRALKTHLGRDNFRELYNAMHVVALEDDAAKENA